RLSPFRPFRAFAIPSNSARHRNSPRDLPVAHFLRSLPFPFAYRTSMRFALAGAVFLAFACSPGGTPDGPRNPSASMTDSTDASAWLPLFDGTSTDAWRGYQMASMPSGWEIVDGSLVRTGSGPDIITREQFGDFELELEWKVGPGGNSGVMYRVTEADSS